MLLRNIQLVFSKQNRAALKGISKEDGYVEFEYRNPISKKRTNCACETVRKNGGRVLFYLCHQTTNNFRK